MQIILWLMGIASGLVTSAGVFALITVIGIIPRMAGRSRTASHIRFYEWAVILGGVLGNLQYLLGTRLYLGYPGLILFGLGTGIFVSCLVMSLAETLDVFPIMIRRTRLKIGLPCLILAFALGKSVGSFLFFFYGWSI